MWSTRGKKRVPLIKQADRKKAAGYKAPRYILAKPPYWEHSAVPSENLSGFTRHCFFVFFGNSLLISGPEEGVHNEPPGSPGGFNSGPS